MLIKQYQYINATPFVSFKHFLVTEQKKYASCKRIDTEVKGSSLYLILLVMSAQTPETVSLGYTDISKSSKQCQ